MKHTKTTENTPSATANHFQVRHYDGTVSLHGDFAKAVAEAGERLEPWRDPTDRVVCQENETPGSELNRVLVVNSVSEPTDAASYVSPCGDWIDARSCLPSVNQRVLARWLEEGEPNDITEFSISDTEFIRWALKHAHKPTRAWWRPMPPLPQPCQGATQC